MGEKSTHNQSPNADRASDGFFKVFSSYRKRRWVLFLAFVAWRRQVTSNVIPPSEKKKVGVCQRSLYTGSQPINALS